MRGETAAPVSVKIRSGWDRQSLNYVETVAKAIDGGAALICLHPRTRTQGFSGRADWSHLADLRRRVGVPVFGSGDLFSAEDAARMMIATGCDGVMLARGAIGDPFLFARTLRLFSGLPPEPPPSPEQRLTAALAQLSLSIALAGEDQACRKMRKHFSAYTKGIPGGSELRSRAIRAAREAEYRALVEEYLGKKISDLSAPSAFRV
jgi:tRNA-dihydrouridine synthase